MALDGYGVLKGKAVDRRREGSSSTPHFQIRVADGAGTDYRIAVNVKSQASPSELLYLVDEDFRHPVTGALETIAAGWHELQSAAGGASLDYVRGNLFDPAQMRSLPPDAAGPDNDLADVLDSHVMRRSATRPPTSTPSASAGGRRTACPTRSSASRRETACTTST